MGAGPKSRLPWFLYSLEYHRRNPELYIYLISQRRTKKRGALTEQRKNDIVHSPSDDAWVGDFGALKYEENRNEDDEEWA